MSWSEVEPDVYYPSGGIVSADDADLRLLLLRAEKSPRGRARLCAHPSPKDGLHEMLICLTQGSYIRPHRHHKVESALVLRGECDLVLFDEQGEISDVLLLSAVSSGTKFFMRLSDPTYHTYVLRSEVLFFLETTLGPFDRNMTEYAPWSPDDNGPVEDYRADLNSRVAEWIKAYRPVTHDLD